MSCLNLTLQNIDQSPPEEASGNAASVVDLMDKAEEMMQNLTVQITKYASYEQKSPKVTCIERGSSPVAVTKRSAKVLCKPYSKNVAVMSMPPDNKANVSIQVNDDSFQVNVVNRGTSTNALDIRKAESLLDLLHEESLESHAKNVPVDNESTNESISQAKTKLIVQQLPCIDIRRSLMVQKIPDIVITPTESFPEKELLHDNNVGYIIMKHFSDDRTDTVAKPSKDKKKHACGCTDTDADANNLSANQSILKISASLPYENPRESTVSSVVSFDYDHKVFSNTKSTQNDDYIVNEYYNSFYKSNESLSQVINGPDDHEQDIFERKSNLSTKLKEFVKDVRKDPRTELMFKSFQLLNDTMEIDVEGDHEELDLSSVDINFYKTFVDPNGPKNTDIECKNSKASCLSNGLKYKKNSISTASSVSKLKEQVQPEEAEKFADVETSNQTFLPLTEFQQFVTSNDTTKPSDSDFSEVLVGLTKNTARNSYLNDERDDGENNIDLRQIENDPVLKVRELYQEAVRTSRKSGQFSIDFNIPPDIQEKLHGARRSSVRRTETEFKGIEPFTKVVTEQAIPRMIDINVNNFMNSKSVESTSIYSDTTEDVILEIDTEALREAQHQSMSIFRGNVTAWNATGQTGSEYVITHDIAIQTSLVDIPEQLVAPKDTNDNTNPSDGSNRSAVLPTAPLPKLSSDSTNQRKSVKIEEPSRPIQNKSANEVKEIKAVNEVNDEQSVITFIAQLTNPGIEKDPVLLKTFTPSNTQGVLSKYYTAENVLMIDTSTQTSNSQAELFENITDEGQTQTDVWRAEINPPVFPECCKVEEVSKMSEVIKSDPRGDDARSGENAVNNSERSVSPQNLSSCYKPEDSSTSSSPILTTYTNQNKAWESTSNSEPFTATTTSEKSDGEINVKCSASIGEIHNCSSKSTPRHLRKYPQDLIVREFDRDHMKIRRRKVYNRNWISYYVSKSSSPEVLDDTSDSIGLVKRK